MRLKLDATEAELRDKGPALMSALSKAFERSAPAIAEALSKAAQPSTAAEPEFPVMRGLRDEMAAAYDRQMKLMVSDIMAVIDQSVVPAERE